MFTALHVTINGLKKSNNTLGFVLCASGRVTLLSWHIQFLAKGILALFFFSYLNFYCFIWRLLFKGVNFFLIQTEFTLLLKVYCFKCFELQPLWVRHDQRWDRKDMRQLICFVSWCDHVWVWQSFEAPRAGAVPEGVYRPTQVIKNNKMQSVCRMEQCENACQRGKWRAVERFCSQANQ